MRLLVRRIVWLVYAAFATNVWCRGNPVEGTLHRRNYFYVGGSFIQQSVANGTIVHGQMYVEHLVPVKVTKPYPLLFIEGMGMTGTNILNTPDGRLGWADYFMSKGYEVLPISSPNTCLLCSTVSSYTLLTNQPAHDLLGYRVSMARLHTQWPGNGSFGNPTYDQFYKSMHPALKSAVETSNLILSAGSRLIESIGDVILLTHSQSGPFGWTLGDANPSKVKAIVALEPTGPPFGEAVFSTVLDRPYGITTIPVIYDPPLLRPSDLRKVVDSFDSSANYTCYKQAEPARKLANLSKFPIFMITSQSSYHAVYDGCTAQFLAQAGVDVQHVRLEDIGIYGNGHMMFMEKNNIEVADVVLRWLDRTFEHHAAALSFNTINV
ncbi:hypothetical protein HWV62_36051 [Athelia sp. TMB]|nr:hypothetical protein HWV62_36051 [Athelia sp. TMB]